VHAQPCVISSSCHAVTFMPALNTPPPQAFSLHVAALAAAMWAALVAASMCPRCCPPPEVAWGAVVGTSPGMAAVATTLLVEGAVLLAMEVRPPCLQHPT
jgi:hypothetical protein